MGRVRGHPSLSSNIHSYEGEGGRGGEREIKREGGGGEREERGEYSLPASLLTQLHEAQHCLGPRINTPLRVRDLSALPCTL